MDGAEVNVTENGCGRWGVDEHQLMHDLLPFGHMSPEGHHLDLVGFGGGVYGGYVVVPLSGVVEVLVGSVSVGDGCVEGDQVVVPRLWGGGRGAKSIAVHKRNVTHYVAPTTGMKTEGRQETGIVERLSEQDGRLAASAEGGVLHQFDEDAGPVETWNAVISKEHNKSHNMQRHKLKQV